MERGLWLNGRSPRVKKSQGFSVRVRLFTFSHATVTGVVDRSTALPQRTSFIDEFGATSVCPQLVGTDPVPDPVVVAVSGVGGSRGRWSSSSSS